MNKEEIHQMALKAFKENNNQPMSIEELSTSQGMDRKKIKKYRVLYNADIGFPDVTKTIIRIIDVFDDPLTPEAAYWIGYIAADGCIAKGQTPTSQRLMLECKIEDREILKKFCDFVGLRTNRISLGHKGRSCCLDIYNKNFTTFPTEYGIAMRKSYKENHIDKRILNNDELFYQYLKGYMDGDGTVCMSKSSLGINFYGDQTLLLEIKDKLSQDLPYPHLWMYKYPEHASTVRPLYILKAGVGFKRANLHFFYKKFYENSFVVLTRKYQRICTLLGK